MSNLISLETVEVGSYCFNSASVFSLTGNRSMKSQWIETPSLQSIKFGDYAFRNAQTFEMRNLLYLRSVEFGERCFDKQHDGSSHPGASSFALVGWNHESYRMHRPPLSSVCHTGGASIYIHQIIWNEKSPFSADSYYRLCLFQWLLWSWTCHFFMAGIVMI